MKALLINDKLAVIEDSIYFPFTYTISDLDNINIINVPSSKQINIPRCNQNDEIFGYIGEMTRYNIGFSDNQSGIKFNQIKKCTYKLLSDSEIVSKGILEVVSATDKEYGIVLYDELLDALETYDKVYLKDVPLYDSFKNPFDIRCNVDNYHSYLGTSITPVMCIDEANTTSTELICNIQETDGGALTYGPTTIPFKSSNMQLRSIAPSDCRWAINNTSMLYSINQLASGPLVDYQDIVGDIGSTYLLSNKPSNKYSVEDTLPIIEYNSGAVNDFTIPISSLISVDNVTNGYVDSSTGADGGYLSTNLRLITPIQVTPSTKLTVTYNGSVTVKIYQFNLSNTYLGYATLSNGVQFTLGTTTHYIKIEIAGTGQSITPNFVITNSIILTDLKSSENNGKLYTNIPIVANYTKTLDGLFDNYESIYYDGNSTTPFTVSNATTGTYLGEHYAYISLMSTLNGVEYESEKLCYVVPLYYGVNCIYSAKVGGIYPVGATVTLSFTLTINGPIYTAPFNKIRIRLTPTPIDVESGNPYTPKTYLFDINGLAYPTVTTSNIHTAANTIIFKNDKFVDGNHLNSTTLLPKISVKTYLLTLAKYYNYKLTMKDDRLTISKIAYKIVNDVPIIEDGGTLQLTTITDSKLALNTNKPDFSELDQYKIVWGAEYAQQTINTGYRIKDNTKNVKYDLSVPLELKDTNPFAYDVFLKYLNNGYQRQSAGVVSGTDDKLTFCYVRQINDKMHVGSKYFPDTIENNAVLDRLWLTNPDQLLNRWIRVTTSTSQPWDDYYYTATPYKYSGNMITNSLDMNKPHINYADILDSNYPDTTVQYYKYHKNMLTDKFDSNTHIISCSMYLSENPLSIIFNIYNIKGSYYIISELPEYDPTQPGMYDVKLMKVNNPVNYTNPYN